MYDANSFSGLLQANGGVVPAYDFSRANVIVSIGADFLGTWLSPVEFARQYVTNRKVSSDKKSMSRHYQFETTLSLTGSNADTRVPIKPSEVGPVVAALYAEIVGGGNSTYKNASLTKAANELKANRGRSVVVAGSNDPNVQAVVAAINQSLGNVGTTIDLTNPSLVRQGNDAQMTQVIDDIKAKRIGGVIFYNANPVYDHPMGADLAAALPAIPLTISLNDRLDETGSLCYYAAPDSHYLESWNDFEPKKGNLSLSQPAISPLFATRQAQDSFLAWTGNQTSYYNYLRTQWRGVLKGDFQAAWDKAVHDGVVVGTASPAPKPMTAPDAATAVSALNTSAKSGDVELVLYEKVGIGNGFDANNPWLQELPDPISKATWGNYVCVPFDMAKANKWEQGDVLKVTAANGKSVELPVLVQPGQAKGTVAIAIGYGRTRCGKVGDLVGQNVYPLAAMANGSIVYATTAKLTATDAKSPIAQTQTHHTIMDRRSILQESTLAKYIENPKEVTEYEKVSTPDGLQAPARVSLWQDYEYRNHHWGMAIDLNSCIGLWLLRNRVPGRKQCVGCRETGGYQPARDALDAYRPLLQLRSSPRRVRNER